MSASVLERALPPTQGLSPESDSFHIDLVDMRPVDDSPSYVGWEEPGTHQFMAPNGGSPFRVDITNFPATNDPAGNSPVRLIHLPGLTENTPHPFVWARGETAARDLGMSGLIALGHNAIGIPGAHDAQTRAEVAAVRLAVVKKIAQPDKKYLLLGCSMGSIVAADMLALNAESENSLAFAGAIYFAPAVRSTSELSWNDKAKFAGQMVRDGIREVVSRPPGELVRGVNNLASWATEAVRSRQGVAHQIGQIISSTNFEVLDHTVESTPTLVIYGDRDHVPDGNLWQELASRHPDMLRIVVVPRHGHEIMDHPTKAGAKIAKEARAFFGSTLPLSDAA